MNVFEKLATLFFGFPEIIDGHGRVEYLRRWTIWRHSSGDGRKLYLHHFLRSDWSRDLHDHPKAFTSIGLWGSYVEQTPGVRQNQVSGRYYPEFWFLREQVFRAPWFRRFKATHIHRLKIAPGKRVWTLCYVGKNEREWGFFVKDPGTGEVEWVVWDHYIQSEAADRDIANEGD